MILSCPGTDERGCSCQCVCVCFFVTFLNHVHPSCRVCFPLVHSKWWILLCGDAGGEPLQHLSAPEVQGEELVCGAEEERQAQTGPSDPHRAESHLLPPAKDSWHGGVIIMTSRYWNIIKLCRCDDDDVQTLCTCTTTWLWCVTTCIAELDMRLIVSYCSYACGRCHFVIVVWWMMKWRNLPKEPAWSVLKCSLWLLFKNVNVTLILSHAHCVLLS